jgi:hypothetical protein
LRKGNPDPDEPANPEQVWVTDFPRFLVIVPTRTSMEGRKTAMAYFRRTKLFLRAAPAMAANMRAKRIPAAARISRSFSTGMR